MNRPLESDKRHPIGGKAGSQRHLLWKQSRAQGCFRGPQHGGEGEAVGRLTSSRILFTVSHTPARCPFFLVFPAFHPLSV